MKPHGQPSSRSASPRPFPHPGKLHNPAHALWAYNLSRRSDGFKKRMPGKMIFREMRRKKQLLSKADAIAILNSCTSGVLGLTGDHGYPYTVPLSYVYKDHKLFFHVANEGHKIDSLKRNDRVSFCVIEQDVVVPEAFSTLYRSVIVFGRARILTADDERSAALQSLLEKYSPGFIEEGQRIIEREWDRVCLVEVAIEHMTGKAAIELLKQKES